MQRGKRPSKRCRVGGGQASRWQCVCVGVLSDLPGKLLQLRGALGPPCLFLAGRDDGNIYLSCGVWHCRSQAPSGKLFSESHGPSPKELRGAGLGQSCGTFSLGRSSALRHLSRAGSPLEATLLKRGLPLCQASSVNSRARPGLGFLCEESTCFPGAVSPSIYFVLRFAPRLHLSPSGLWARQRGPGPRCSGQLWVPPCRSRASERHVGTKRFTSKCVEETDLELDGLACDRQGQAKHRDFPPSFP